MNLHRSNKVNTIVYVNTIKRTFNFLSKYSQSDDHHVVYVLRNIGISKLRNDAPFAKYNAEPWLSELLSRDQKIR